jgi:signal transduction histidine kinase
MTRVATTDWPERSKRAEARLAALDDALAAIGGELVLDRVLQLIVDRVRTFSAARYAALGLFGLDGHIETLITSGISPAARQRIGPLPTGHGLLGAVIREGRTIRLADVATDPRSSGVPAHHFPVHSFLGVPITIRGRAVGNLYLANKRGDVPFSADDQNLVERFALHAGIAIDNARLLLQVQRLAIVEERERIGRELHDSVIQRLYGLSLGLEDVPELMTEDPAAAGQRVDHSIEGLHAVIAEIRDFIYGLRVPLAAPGDLRSSMVALADEVSRASTVPIDVDVIDVPLTADVGGEVVAMTREALTNVIRHSGASHAQIELRMHGDVARLTVRDDGRGFDSRGRRTRDHHGLSNIRDRATALGGRMTVRSRPGAGTRIIVDVPMSFDR